tara:strand:+ start:487 stop:759 length:273 start_codon:yes stop_codon:yes gene_type:complete
MESEKLNLLIDIKQIFELSQSRGCWKLNELKNLSTLYEGLCDMITHYENENKKPDPEPEPESELEEDPKITKVTSEIQNNESDNVMEEIN